jgi:hypothetical protein
VVLMDSLAPHYDNDFWFMSYHAMALSEDGQLPAARAKIEQSLAANPNNAHGAHGFAHIYYESGELEAARTFLSSWLVTYPRDGFFYGHLSWHLSLCEILAGNWAEAFWLYRDAIALDRHSGGPQQKVSDGAAFLWRSELAGHPRDAAAWRALCGYANSALPRSGNGLADLHVILVQAVMGGDAALDTRARQIEELAREGRYPSGTYLPALAQGFAAFDGDPGAHRRTQRPCASHNDARRIATSRWRPRNGSCADRASGRDFPQTRHAREPASVKAALAALDRGVGIPLLGINPSPKRAPGRARWACVATSVELRDLIVRSGVVRENGALRHCGWRPCVEIWWLNPGLANGRLRRRAADTLTSGGWPKLPLSGRSQGACRSMTGWRPSFRIDRS